jgi:hypothetical protein
MFMLLMRTRVLVLLAGVLLLAGLAYAGGGEEAARKSSYRTAPAPVTATPEETAAAVSRARQAVTPKAAPASATRTVVMPESKPVAVAPAKRQSQPGLSADQWMVSSDAGRCSSLESLPQQAASLGTIETPQQMAKNARQRGYQSFLLDLSDASGESFRVKVPDLDLNLLFVRPQACK